MRETNMGQYLSLLIQSLEPCKSFNDGGLAYIIIATQNATITIECYTGILSQSFTG